MNVPEVFCVEGKPFWEHPNYEAKTKEEFSRTRPLRPIFVYNSESAVWRYTKIALAIIIFPIGLYQLAHYLVGKLIFSIALESKIADRSKGFGPFTHDQVRRQLFERKIEGGKRERVYKRFTILVDGSPIDAMLCLKPSRQSNRIALWAFGKRENYEYTFRAEKKDGSPNNIEMAMDALNAGVIAFNYPEVGANKKTGFFRSRLTEKTIVNAHLAFRKFIQETLIPKETIYVGHSFGASVQSSSLQKQPPKSGEKFSVVSSRTFDTFHKAVLYRSTDHPEKKTTLFCRIKDAFLSLLPIFFGWNANVRKALKPFCDKHVVVQVTQEDKKSVSHDTIIHPEAAFHKHEDTHRFVGVVGQKHDTSLKEGDWKRIGHEVGHVMSA